MNGTDLNRTWRATLWQFLALIGILARFLPALGPLLDHHFVERQPNHNHVYLGAQDLTHSHTPNAAHTHEPGQSPATVDIVYLTSDEGYYGSSTPLGSPALPGSLRLPEPPEFLPSHRLMIDSGILLETFIAPPAPPPRV